GEQCGFVDSVLVENPEKGAVLLERPLGVVEGLDQRVRLRALLEDPAHSRGVGELAGLVLADRDAGDVLATALHGVGGTDRVPDPGVDPAVVDVLQRSLVRVVRTDLPRREDAGADLVVGDGLAGAATGKTDGLPVQILEALDARVGLDHQTVDRPQHRLGEADFLLTLRGLRQTDHRVNSSALDRWNEGGRGQEDHVHLDPDLLGDLVGELRIEAGPLVADQLRIGRVRVGPYVDEPAFFDLLEQIPATAGVRAASGDHHQKQQDCGEAGEPPPPRRSSHFLLLLVAAEPPFRSPVPFLPSCDQESMPRNVRGFLVVMSAMTSAGSPLFSIRGTTWSSKWP